MRESKKSFYEMQISSVLLPRDVEKIIKTYRKKILIGLITREEAETEVHDFPLSSEQHSQVKNSLKKAEQKRIAQLDKHLWDILKILKSSPKKWSIDKNNNIVIVYPTPILKDNYVVKNIEYSYTPFSINSLPKSLCERYEHLCKEGCHTLLKLL